MDGGRSKCIRRWRDLVAFHLSSDVHATSGRLVGSGGGRGQEEEGGRPLPDEDGPIVLARELEHRGDSDRAQRRPVPRFLGHIVRNAKKVCCASAAWSFASAIVLLLSSPARSSARRPSMPWPPSRSGLPNRGSVRLVSVLGQFALTTPGMISLMRSIAPA